MTIFVNSVSAGQKAQFKRLANHGFYSLNKFKAFLAELITSCLISTEYWCLTTYPAY